MHTWWSSKLCTLNWRQCHRQSNPSQDSPFQWKPQFLLGSTPLQPSTESVSERVLRHKRFCGCKHKNTGIAGQIQLNGEDHSILHILLHVSYEYRTENWEMFSHPFHSSGTPLSEKRWEHPCSTLCKKNLYDIFQNEEKDIYEHAASKLIQSINQLKHIRMNNLPVHLIQV